jgi:hypothetical protein
LIILILRNLCPPCLPWSLPMDILQSDYGLQIFFSVEI